MLLDSDQTYESTLHHLLEARRAAIHDICVSATHDRLSFQLREIVQIVQRTLIHVHAIFFGDTTLERLVDRLRENFMLDGSIPPITRVFSVRTNVHLLIRYLPPSVQNFTPSMAGCGTPLATDTVRKHTQTWLHGIETLVREQLPTMLQPIQTHRALVETRNRLWQVLDKEKRKTNTLVPSSSSSPSSSWPMACEALLVDTQATGGYAIWDVLFRDAFNAHAETLVRQTCDQLSAQPKSLVWPRLMDDSAKKDFTLSCMTWSTSAQAPHKTSLLPNSASANEIQDFKRALTEVAHDRTRWLRDLQSLFDQALHTMRTDMMSYIERDVSDHFHAKTDTQNILEYFKNTCAQAISQYAVGLQDLISDLNGWSDTAKANDLALFIGRLARILATFSDELVRTLSLSITGRYAGLELRSRIDLDPRCKELKATLVKTYHTAHARWIETVSKQFERQLGSALARTHWNDENPGFLLWEGKRGQKKHERPLFGKYH
ncbi:hypothetical protein BCR43DRAFT_443959 [Syncephalastrum racemosum]|uniref:Conserved oligomeric Golgi complex subunit 1 n=1 Tax=Syncephalastrum racemosum TaxID=13706 RepID=A0A1X2H6X9_SYNRA|nr:hypothetical protein BCR43DRAFT_443959 [Syncephalastrum racemosum]